MSSMETSEVDVLGTVGNVPDLESNFTKPFHGGTYESYESFMETLAPMAELPERPISTDACNSLIINSSNASISSNPEAESGPEEIKSLKNMVALLQIRLNATSQVAEIQENELCREMDGDEDSRSNYEKLLTRWRREVCVLMLKQRVDALQVEQRRLQDMQKEQHLTVQLHEARALVEVLKQKERNLQAEIGILTTGQKLAEMTMRAEAARRQHELEGTVKGVTRTAIESICIIVEEYSTTMCFQLERLSQASCRLELYGERLSSNERQIVVVASIVDSEKKSSGYLTHRKKVEENLDKARLDRKRDRAVLDQIVRRSENDYAGRTNQLEVLLAATKSQLSEECLHARELQDRIGKVESEGREAVKRATRKAQEQADRDLVAIKRQHTQNMQSLQQKITKLQNEHAKSVVAHHQLERKLSQQQQEFVQTLNQRDNEFRKSLDAKEIEVNGLLDEQNALLNKLKKFWRPVLNSSAAKIFTERNQRSQLQTPAPSRSYTPVELKCEDLEGTSSTSKSVQTQTSNSDVRHEKKKTTPKQDDKKETGQRHQEKKEPTDKTEFLKHKKADSQSLSSSRLSTPAKMSRQELKLRKSEDDLISSYLNKLHKSYITSNKQTSPNQNSTTRSLDLLLGTNPDPSCPSTSKPNLQAHHGDRSSTDARLSSQSLKQSYVSEDTESARRESLPQYIICVPPQDAVPGSAVFMEGQRKNQAAENSRTVLQEKLENLEALSETLLGHRM